MLDCSGIAPRGMQNGRSQSQVLSIHARGANKACDEFLAEPPWFKILPTQIWVFMTQFPWGPKGKFRHDTDLGFHDTISLPEGTLEAALASRFLGS